MAEENKIKDAFYEGLAAFRKGNYGESICDLSGALLLDPGHELARLTRGVAYMNTDRVKLAIDDFSKAIETNPVYGRAYHLRGMAYATLGDLERAERDFDKAIELKPEYGAAYLSRANLLSQMGQEERAKEDMKMVTRLTEKNVQTFADTNNVWRSRHLRLEAEEIVGEIER